MATVDKAISDLIEAQEVTEADNFVLEQNSVAKKLTGRNLLKFLFTMLDGHGGTLSIKKTDTSGLVDTYTITLADGATSKFTVTNGEKGDKGDRSRVWFKYANAKPTDSYHSIYDVPGPWMGVCANYEDTAPDDWQAYTWAQIQGDPGKMGPVGPAPKFSIGSVSSLEYGSEPWVQIHGSAENPILHFGIPRGKPGKDGTGAPDLAINDPEAPGYVAGRTHYRISDAAFILESSIAVDDTGVNENDPAYFYGALWAGDTAAVTWSGNVYHCPVRDVSDALGEYEQIAFGNLHLIDAAFDDTGEPFAFRFDSVYTRVYSPAYAGQTVPFSLSRREMVQKLDNVFLDMDWVPAKEETGTDGLVMKSRQLTFRESASITAASMAATGGGFDLKAGGLYTVTWSGAAYDCRCVEGEDGGLYLGDPALAGLTGGSGEPFCIQAFRSGSDKIISSLIVYKETEDTQTVTLEILGHKEVTYDKIPEEFLPEGYGGGGGGTGEDGGYYTPVVTQPDANTMQVSYTPSKTGMPSVAPKSIALPAGPQGPKGETGATGPVGPQGAQGEAGPAGTNGKSAYAYAQEGGYTGTEAEFAAKLAQELPTALPNPHALTINGQSYDGSAPVEVNISGSSGGGTELVLSDNLFDKSTAISGKAFYHSSSGTQIIDNSDRYCAYVELRGAGTYRTKIDVSYHSESYAQRVPLMNADKGWIQNITGTITDTGDSTAWDLEFTVTQDMIDGGAVYYPLTVHKNNIDTLMMVKDREYPTQYIPYGYIEVATDEDASGLLTNVLYEKTAVFLGDSICAGDIDDSEYDGYGWAGLIGEANGMAWKNYGRNGGTITPIESVVAQSRDLFSQADLAAADCPDADYVIFEGGTNDADQLTMTGIGVISDDFETFDVSTFSGAMESLILKLMTTFPNAQIGYIVAQKMGNPPYTSAGSTRRKFFDRAVEICQKWGVPVIDLWNGGLLNPALTYHAENFYTDKQHLTLAGYQRISPQIEAWMRNLTMPGAVSGGGSTEAVPADWNAAEGEPGHVLNRTHYEVFGKVCEEVIIDTSILQHSITLTDSIIPGKTYAVHLGEDTYNCTAVEYMGTVALGNLGAFGFGEDTGEPFLMATIGTKAEIVCFLSDGEKVFSIDGDVIVRIPEKFLPERMKTYTIEVTSNDISSNNGVAIMPQPFDLFIDRLYSGGTVTIKTILIDDDGQSIIQVSNITNYVWTYVDDGNGEGPVPVVFVDCPMFMGSDFSNAYRTLRFNGTIPPPTS